MPFAKKVFADLTAQLASAFSEQIFSFAGRTSKGDQCNTGAMKLNGRQFVFYNLPLMFDSFKRKLTDIAVHRSSYSKLVEDWVKECEDIEIELSTATIREEAKRFSCGVCDNFGCFKKFTVDKEIEECDTPDHKFKAKEIFYGCTNCNEFDLCQICYTDYI